MNKFYNFSVAQNMEFSIWQKTNINQPIYLYKV